MRKKMFLLYLFLCIGICCNAQQNQMGYDTIPIAEEHEVCDFTLYAIVPRMFAGIHIEQRLRSCRVFVQVDAHIDVGKEGELADQQNNSSSITILVIEDVETGNYLYSKYNKLDDSMSAFLEELNSYFQKKFANVHYYLSGQYVIPSEMTYFYVENIQ